LEGCDAIAALLTRTSIRPVFSSIAAMAVLTATSSLTSAEWLRHAQRRRDQLYKRVKAALALPAGPERVAALQAKIGDDRKH
jgi:hypothetical protein